MDSTSSFGANSTSFISYIYQGEINSTKSSSWVVSKFIKPFTCYSKYFEITGFIVAIIGLTFNWFVYVISNSFSNKTSNHIWMSYLSIADSLALASNGVLAIGIQFFDLYPLFANSAVCKTLSYTSWACGLNANMHVVALAMDRALILFYPIWHSSKPVKTWNHIIRKLSFTSFLFYHLLALPVWFFHSVEDGICTMEASSFTAISQLFNISLCIIYVFGQLLPLFGANVTCIWKLRQYQKNQRRRPESVDGQECPGNDGSNGENEELNLPRWKPLDLPSNPVLNASRTRINGEPVTNLGNRFFLDVPKVTEREKPLEKQNSSSFKREDINIEDFSHGKSVPGSKANFCTRQGSPKISTNAGNRVSFLKTPKATASSAQFYEAESIAFNLVGVHNSEAPKNKSKDIKIIIPVLMISISYVVLGVFPALVLIAIEALEQNELSQKERHFLLMVGLIFYLLNISTNFFFYLHSRNFRNQLNRRITSLIGRCRRFYARLCCCC